MALSLVGAAVLAVLFTSIGGAAWGDDEVLEPSQPGILGRGADLFRIRQLRPRLDVGSRGMIRGDFSGADVSWARSGGDVSVAAPVSKRFAVEPRLAGESVNFDFGGDNHFLDTGRSGGKPFDDLIALSFRVDGRYVWNEHWASLAGVSIASHIEDGAPLNAGRQIGGSVGGVYSHGKLLRVMLGVGVRERLTRSGVSVVPLFYLDWRPTPWLQLETQRVGLRATATLRRALRVFAFGGVRSDRYRLRDRKDGTDGVGEGSLRDRRAAAGVGVEWRATDRLRLEFNTGAVIWQQLKVVTEDNDDFDKATMNDPAAFLSLRARFRF